MKGAGVMMNKKIEKAFNLQIKEEMYSSYLYLSMSSFFETMNLDGMAAWMKAQAQEELMHAMKFYDFILERGGTVKLMNIDAPPNKWDAPLDMFEAAYEHEKYISGKINKLVDLALTEGDHAANVFLQWFVTEQVEEEASVLTIVEKFKLIGDKKVGTFMMNSELGKRTGASAE